MHDSGIGIAAEDQGIVFEAFRQVDSGYTRKAEGTGLGLSLVKRFVEMQGGSIMLESELGAGSTFRFSLPLDPSEVEPTSESAATLSTD